MSPSEPLSRIVFEYFLKLIDTIHAFCDDMDNKIYNKRCDGGQDALSIIGLFKGSVGIMGVEKMIDCAND